MVEASKVSGVQDSILNSLSPKVGAASGFQAASLVEAAHGRADALKAGGGGPCLGLVEVACCLLSGLEGVLNPKPSTLNPQPSTPKPLTLNP